MKKINRLPYILLLACICIGTSITAQKISLTDINKVKSSNPTNTQWDYNSVFAKLNGKFYFTADDGIHGRELFTSDGTSAGTHLVKDINPGEGSSSVSYITTSGGKLYFVTFNAMTYSETMWVSDGTEAGTVPVANVPYAIYGFFTYLTDVSGTLFFTYNYYNNNGNFAELYKTDATGNNAELVTSINGFILEVVSFKGRLFYSFYDNNTNSGNELYASDGTPAGTGLVADLNTNPYTGSNPGHLTPVNGLLYFAADDGTGTQLWATDGTQQGTYKVNNNNHILLGTNTDASNGGNLYATVNNTIYFQGKVFDGTNSSTGFELCKFNTADPAANVTLVKDIVPGSTGSLPGSFTSVQGSIYFTATANGHLSQLWKTDGTSGGTILLKDFTTGIDPAWPNPFYGFSSVNGKLLFAYTNTSLGTELWKSDGTAAGTVLLKDILPGIAGSFPNEFTTDVNLTFFSAWSAAGNELWRTDGTAAGTIMVKDINTTTTADAQPFGFTTLNDKVIFGANNGGVYSKVYINDSKNGTKLVDTAVNVLPLFFSQKVFAIFKKEAYFFNDAYKLCKTDGTKGGTSVLPLPAFVEIAVSTVSDITATDNLLFVTTYNFNTNMSTLWRTDGTKAGTYILKTDINSNFNIFPTVIGSTLFFANVDNSLGSQLWKTNGTVAGTRVVKTIGSYNYNPLSNLYNFKGKLYFNAYMANSGAGVAIWQSDGTEAGTIVLKDLSVFQQPFGEANGKLFFYAHDNVANLGDELYATDGTVAGTQLVKDINPGDVSSIVYLNPS
ncbi:MAG: ELWxxDGT repeat protein, partial [Ferruginibacter sp.]